VHPTISFNNLNKVNAEIRAGRAGPEQRRVWLWLLLLWFTGFLVLLYGFTRHSMSETNRPAIGPTLSFAQDLPAASITFIAGT
jgi:hypothetical protein